MYHASSVPNGMEDPEFIKHCLVLYGIWGINKSKYNTFHSYQHLLWKSIKNKSHWTSVFLCLKLRRTNHQGTCRMTCVFTSDKRTNVPGYRWWFICKLIDLICRRLKFCSNSTEMETLNNIAVDVVEERDIGLTFEQKSTLYFCALCLIFKSQHLCDFIMVYLFSTYIASGFARMKDKDFGS